MVAIIGIERDLRPAGQAHAVVMAEVRILSLLATQGREVERARLLIDARDLRYRPFAGRDLVLELAGVEIVKVELAPVVSRCEYQMNSFVFQSTRQPVRDSKWVLTVSSNTVRTAPVSASATLSTAFL
jgi:hypothetical protein